YQPVEVTVFVAPCDFIFRRRGEVFAAIGGEPVESAGSQATGWQGAQARQGRLRPATPLVFRFRTVSAGCDRDCARRLPSGNACSPRSVLATNSDAIPPCRIHGRMTARPV